MERSINFFLLQCTMKGELLMSKSIDNNIKTYAQSATVSSISSQSATKSAVTAQPSTKSAVTAQPSTKSAVTVQPSTKSAVSAKSTKKPTATTKPVKKSNSSAKSVKKSNSYAKSVTNSAVSAKSTNVSSTDNHISDKVTQLKKVFDSCSYEELKSDRKLLETCFNSIKKSHDEFIVMGTIEKIDTAYKLDSEGRQGGCNKDDEKFNQGCIDNVKKQVSVMNGIFKKYNIDSVSTSVIQADNIIERAVEIFTGDGYYLKGKINAVIYRVKCNLDLYNDKIEKINSNINDLSSISKLIDSTISDMNSAISSLKNNDIVYGNFSVLNNYTKRVSKTRNNLKDLKAEISKYTKSFSKIEKISTN